jgi:hypothetical protein
MRERPKGHFYSYQALSGPQHTSPSKHTPSHGIHCAQNCIFTACGPYNIDGLPCEKVVKNTVCRVCLEGDECWGPEGGFSGS